MSVSILVVDDSPIARKMLIRALPPAWDVEIAQAQNGIEALEHYRAGKVDVIAACITITEERRKNVLFSEPYYAGGIAALVRQ